MSLLTGCSRTFYRRQADIDAYALVREKATHPHWRLPNYTISVDPRSRMYDPYAIDCPPIPPDDPTAHQLMHCVDNKRGWPFWHDNGDRPYVENPAWPEYIEIDERRRGAAERATTPCGWRCCTRATISSSWKRFISRPST